MGKRILVQRRGKGGIQYRAPVKGKVADARYPYVPQTAKIMGRVEDFVHDRGRSAPLAKIRFDGGRVLYLPAVNGLIKGSQVELGSGAELKPGNILPLRNIPEGTSICNIELNYGDGGRLVRASGGSAILFAHGARGAVVRLPSRKSLVVHENCRASIGGIAGGGRLERPLLKAGRSFHMYRASKTHLFPRVRGIAMASVHHPFGGGRHQHPGKSTSTSRNAPPGRKVGHIAPSKTGRKKKGRRFEE